MCTRPQWNGKVDRQKVKMQKAGARETSEKLEAVEGRHIIGQDDGVPRKPLQFLHLSASVLCSAPAFATRLHMQGHGCDRTVCAAKCSMQHFRQSSTLSIGSPSSLAIRMSVSPRLSMSTTPGTRRPATWTNSKKWVI